MNKIITQQYHFLKNSFKNNIINHGVRNMLEQPRLLKFWLNLQKLFLFFFYGVNIDHFHLTSSPLVLWHFTLPTPECLNFHTKNTTCVQHSFN